MTRGLHNFPAQLPPFVGRSQELVELGQLLAGSRLITLAGGPGMGKTRLALELGARAADRQAGGTWLVRLDSITDPSLVPQTVSTALGIRPEPGRTATASVVGHIGDQAVLVILDNCEHVVDASADLVEALLPACPGLTVLTTSQQPLGVEGEEIWPLAPLSLPGAEAEARDRSEAVALFVARARAVHPDFVLTPELAPAVAEICQALDGIPLAIELAAARTAVMSPVDIAERLGRRFRLLTGGPTAAPARHQTLRSALEWSWGLLSAPEGAVLRRLSVFAGGASLNEVEAVCSGGEVERDDVIDLVAGLVAKSLVAADTSGARARYRLLDTVRAYARERLDEAGEAAVTARRHATTFLAVAERSWQPSSSAPWDESPLAPLERDHDNIRAALEWAVANGQAAMALRLVAALTPFWRSRGYLREGQGWLRRALTVDDGSLPAVRARALWSLGLLATLQGDLATAVPAVEDSIALARTDGFRRAVTEGLILRGFISVLSQDAAAALPFLEEALTLARSPGGDLAALANALNLFGRAHLFLGHADEARSAFEECMRLEDVEGEGSAGGLIGLGWLALAQGRHREAKKLLDEALPLVRSEGERFETALVLSFLGELAWLSGDLPGAKTLLDQGLEGARAIGAPFPLARCLSLLGWVAHAEDDVAAAASLMDEGVDAARRSGLGYALVRTLLARGRLSAAAGDPEGARSAIEEAVELARSDADPAGVAAGLHHLARLVRSEGDDDRAQSLHHEALGLQVDTHDVGGIADSLEALGGLAVVQGRAAHGVHVMAAASSLRAAHGTLRAPPDVARYEDDLAELRSVVEPAEWEAAWAQGAALTVDEAVSLARRGRGRRDRPLRGWASLSDVERQTVALVAEGLTNREAAEALCVSPRTVQGHLLRIFAKLDVSTRRELREAVRKRAEPLV